MGTRHLIAVHVDGQYKIAQYGQWDGYPDTQGVRVLKFLRGMDKPAFIEKCRALRFMSPETIDEFNKKIASGEITNWTRQYPWLSRDAGAEILEWVESKEDGLPLINQIKFAGDSCMCEWAYVIDFDKNTFEVFKGFNKTPLDKSERLANVE